ncbi:hypothetical protein VPH35_137407 [Triticum aestivum]
MLAPVLGAVGCGRGGSGLARPTLPCSFQSGPEVLEEALEVGMLTGDAGSLHPPGSLAIAKMSLSTLSRAIVQVQVISLSLTLPYAPPLLFCSKLRPLLVVSGSKSSHDAVSF